MTEPVSREEARGLLGAMRRLMHAPELTEGMGCAIAAGSTLIAIALVAVLIYVGLRALDSGEPAQTNPEPPPSQTSEVPAEPGAAPAADNPTAVGQAVDAVAQPAIADVYGDALLTRASNAEALIVSLWYDVPMNTTEGDAARLREAFLERGASPDPDNSETDYHAGEEFTMLVETGNPAFKSIRVSISPGTQAVYVNADKSE